MDERSIHMDRLATLSDENLAAVVAVVEQALLIGDGWLQYDARTNRFRAADSMTVVIEERARG